MGRCSTGGQIRVAVPTIQRAGKVYVMSVIDQQAPIAANVASGDYAVYVAGRNLGIDQGSKGETALLTDEELAARKDLEWYRIFLVPGIPSCVGRLKDDP